MTSALFSHTEPAHTAPRRGDTALTFTAPTSALYDEEDPS